MRSILKDISLDELKQMRANGMSNQDIANALNISYPTVYRYLGAQPSRGGRVARTIPEDSVKPARVAHDDADLDYTPVMPVINRVTVLKGQAAVYAVDAGNMTVRIQTGGVEIEIPVEQWERFEAEVAAIGKNLSKVRVGVEMW